MSKRKAFVAVLHMLVVLLLGTVLVQADGEEPFVGKIKSIAVNSMVIELTENKGSLRTAGDEVTLLVGKDTTIRNEARRIIPFKRLKVGSLVWIKPNTLSNKDVKACIVIVEKRRAR